MMSQSEKLAGSQVRTISSATSLGIGDDCFQRTVSLYRLPADRADAPKPTSSNWG